MSDTDLTSLVDKLKLVDLKRLWHFHLAFREKSVLKAAQIAGTSKRVIYNDFVCLEKAFGFQIYSRANQRQFTLTDQGYKLISLTKEVLERFNVLSQDAEGEDFFQLQESVTMYCSTIVSHFLAPRIIRRVFDLFPNVTIDLLTAAEYVENATHMADIMIGAKFYNRADLSHAIMGRCDFGFYATQAYLDKHGHPTTTENFKGHQLILFSALTTIPTPILEHNRDALISSSYPVMAELCAKGLGVASLPIRMIETLGKVDDGNQPLVRLLPDIAPESDTIYFSYRRFSEKDKVIRKILDLARQEFKAVLS